MNAPHDPPLLGTLNKLKLLAIIIEVSTTAVAVIPNIQYNFFLEDRCFKSLPSESIIILIMSC